MAESEGDNVANIIYPAYINKSRTVARGRRIALSNAVVDPKPNEVTDALFNLKGFQAQAEVKPYCRELDKEAVPWRVRYKNVNPSKNNLTTKRQILIACAKRINEVRAKSASNTNQQASGTSGKQKKKKGN